MTHFLTLKHITYLENGTPVHRCNRFRVTKKVRAGLSQNPCLEDCYWFGLVAVMTSCRSGVGEGLYSGLPLMQSTGAVDGAMNFRYCANGTQQAPFFGL